MDLCRGKQRMNESVGSRVPGKVDVEDRRWHGKKKRRKILVS